ncbi:MAG: hypothetical protein R2684_04595 [Pyrinomonadaceae bacterium]
MVIRIQLKLLICGAITLQLLFATSTLAQRAEVANFESWSQDSAKITPTQFEMNLDAKDSTYESNFESDSGVKYRLKASKLFLPKISGYFWLFQLFKCQVSCDSPESFSKNLLSEHHPEDRTTGDYLPKFGNLLYPDERRLINANGKEVVFLGYPSIHRFGTERSYKVDGFLLTLKGVEACFGKGKDPELIETKVAVSLSNSAMYINNP